MRRRILLLCLGTAMWAQETTSKLIQLKNVSAKDVRVVMETFPTTGVRWNVSDRNVVAMTGPSQSVAALEAAISKLDVPVAPPKNVEITFFVLLASSTPEAGAAPPELASVVSQLQGAFAFKSFRLLETAVLRGRENRVGQMSGLMLSPTKSTNPTGTAYYSINFGNIRITLEDQVNRLRLDDLRFAARIPLPADANGQFTYSEPSIKTDIDFREGQKVVVGKTSIDASSHSIFLVVSGKVVD